MATKETTRTIVGITGNIGSGKSTVAHLFESFGAIRISSDEIARRFTDPNTKIKTELREIFGNTIFDEGNNPIREKIAEMAFSDQKLLTSLNSLMHPLIRREFLSLVEKTKDGSIIAWEVPLLFETDAHTICDITVCVTANGEEAWKRVAERGGMTPSDFAKRNSAQWDIEKKKGLSDFVIPNDNSIEELKKNTMTVFEKIKDRTKG